MNADAARPQYVRPPAVEIARRHPCAHRTRFCLDSTIAFEVHLGAPSRGGVGLRT